MGFNLQIQSAYMPSRFGAHLAFGHSVDVIALNLNAFSYLRASSNKLVFEAMLGIHDVKSAYSQ